ncbi:ribosomal-protein-alanine N-acetyltransferase [Mucilaginibacter lappiensis]|uniref:Ribosomal-protein-alanine N-acetyltransferase n=1 Tax=Mucilaginibacter lappiensis TaxID=354630 RepID=A0ABR6PGA1_9SPHI|nr:GNAT family protein [Mucilaginibacter lappiensis]MBB6108789.1 ribosomal-protein-alanine N-acetyltransferase [Mucilaginibacter lappiensis]SIQ62288.1 ribosomal-protein-alanine N-acetyltransferase [Mucilaginibacter lappiensis]
MLNLNFDPFPVLTTERLILRRFTFADAPKLFELRKDPVIMQYISRPLSKTLDDAIDLIKVINDLLKGNNGITWCITLKNEQEFVGSIGFWRIEKENYRAEIGYLLNPAYQGRGIMQEAIETIINYGFGPMSLHTIQANVSPDNLASIKLLQKNNFTQEAYFKENYFFNGVFEDTLVYTLLTKT